MPTVWNPGEPVFDQSTGEPVINPATGDAVIVEPNGTWTDPTTGTVHQADDVVNAAWWRLNTYVGEVLRSQSDGVDYHNVIFGMPVVEELINAEIRSTALKTPGLAALTDARRVSYEPDDRSASWIFRVRKRDGTQVPGLVTLSG